MLRKGGIQETGGAFVADQKTFWLFPTQFHQKECQLSDEGLSFLRQLREPEPGFIRLAVGAVVTDVIQIGQEDVLPRLRPYHIYADEVLVQRFHYKRPGLTLMIVRAAIVAEPIAIPATPHFDGCRSWVDLPRAVEGSSLHPAMDDAAFERVRREVRDAAKPNITA